MGSFNGIADLGWLGEDTAAQQQPTFSQSNQQSQSVSTQVSAQATGGSIANSANVGSRVGTFKGKAADLPWGWIVGAVVATGIAAYFLMGGGVRFQNPIQFNPPPRRRSRSKRRSRSHDDSDED